MADTPIFESEKHVKKQRKRRTLLIVFSVLLILAAAATIAFFVSRCSEETNSGGEDLPIPFTWKQSSDGSVLLSVPRENGLIWRIEDAGDAFGTISFASAGSTNDAFEFKLTPKAEGRSLVRIILGEENGTEGDKYRMEFMSEAYREGGKLRCRILNASCKSISEAMITDGAFSYRIYTDDDGDMVIEVPNTDSDWDCVSSNEDAVVMTGVVYGEEVVRAYLRAGNTTGSSEVKLTSEIEGRELTAVFTNNGQGGLIIDEKAVSTVQSERTPTPEPVTIPSDIELMTTDPNATSAPVVTFDPSTFTFPPWVQIIDSTARPTETPEPTQNP